ncbi:MAG: SurA N-terminal domain-containing protein [Proteobacteria bacterium]|nr:SurA N-terminal domain-containing protein [Pseudomonadota bacterium]
MLQDLRDQKNSWLIVLLFGIIIIVFVFMFGLPSMDSSCKSNSQVELATVGSHDIGYEMLRTMIYRYYDDNILSSPQYPAFAEQLVKNIALIYLLADEAREAGLRVSDADLQDYITNWESGNSDVIQQRFLNNQNKFSSKNYENALSRLSISKRDYENFKREELLARRYLTLLASSISVSEESLWQQYAADNDAATIEIVRLTAAEVGMTFKPLTDEELAGFEVSNMADIDKYYNEHLGDYTTPAKAKLQQVTIQKSLTNVKNPGEKTITTYLSAERFAIARAKIVDDKLDFDQAFVDYDESDNKDAKGMTALLSIEIMADEIRDALEGKKAGDIITAELADRYVIARVVEQTDKIVTPLNEVKRDIAAKVMNDKRISARIDEAANTILTLAKNGQTLADALNASLYANVLEEAPVAAPAPEAPADGTADGTPADTTDGTPAPAAVEAPAPVAADQVIVSGADRIQVKTLSDIATNTGFIMGLGINDDLARDIRGASENTVLPKVYPVGQDMVIARVVSKKGADRAAFAAELPTLRETAIASKTLQLIGDPDEILGMGGRYGFWIEQKLNAALVSKKLTINEDYFARERNRREKAARERAEGK